MLNYLARRLLLLPITLFCIVLVNFVIVNLAPGDPVTVTQISPEGATRRQEQTLAFGTDFRFLQFREFYGLTLPVLFNRWPWISYDQVRATLDKLVTHRESPGDSEEMSIKDYDALRILFGDQSRFVMPLLLKVMLDPTSSADEVRMASRFFARGGTRQAVLGPNLTQEQKQWNQRVGIANSQLLNWVIEPADTPEIAREKVEKMVAWYGENKNFYKFEPDFSEKVSLFFFDTRFSRYMGRVLTLDFGTMRNDDNKRVIDEVVKRFKYSLTLSLTPMLITFVVCQVLGVVMAVRHSGKLDYGINLVLLFFYAVPVFVAAPFLIEKVALNHTFPFTSIPIPISGFTSPDSVYQAQTSLQRVYDVLQHIALPLVAILYGTLAAQARLARTAVLEVLRHDYVRTARAKGVSMPVILFKHVGRNAAITIVTSIASSLGIILGGSLIVETLFEIDGFGKFFYEAILNRDYNVIMFSALAGAFLSLMGYLVADIAYTLLDPRVTLD